MWVRFTATPYPAPYPGLVLEWRRTRAPGHWEARVVWVEDARPGKALVKDGWVAAEFLRPARSDWNIWD